MTEAEFKRRFLTLPVELQGKIRDLNKTSYITKEERLLLLERFGPKWEEYFFGKGFTPTK